MQILFFDTLKTVFVDIVTWVCLHLGIGYWCSRIPIEQFDINQRFYQTFRWEKGGTIYQQLFHVRSWKRFIPQGSKLYRDAFSLQNLPNMEPAFLMRWVQESIRAEFCHWMMVFPSIFFFLWNGELGGWLMVAYAALNNFFPIVAQRFNRPRIRRYLEQTRQTPVALPSYSAGMQPAQQFASSHSH
jgi:glycosyl-4,4'-diaponeurosporenoate acyltransferase